MKPLFIIFTLLLVTICSFAQISPSLKTGLGYPYVLNNEESIGSDFHTITGYPTVLIEKPFPIEIRLKKRMSINPGVAYYFFKEGEVRVREDTINGNDFKKDFKLNHHSIDGYVKILYQTLVQRNRETFVYFGGIAGIHVYTKTKGNKTTYWLNNHTPIVDIDVNQNGKEFFDLFYYGAVAGFQPHAKKTNFIKPSFEISYYPGFGSTANETIQITYKNVNTLQLTVLLGFRIK